MKYLQLKSVKSIGNYELVAYVATNPIENILGNAQQIPMINTHTAARRMGNMLANGQKWVLLNENDTLVGETISSGAAPYDFYNNSIIDNCEISSECVRAQFSIIKKLRSLAKKLGNVALAE